jgi:hypothetical protein
MAKKREPYFAGLKRIKTVSYGLIYIFFLLWLIFHTEQVVPSNQTDFWFKILIGYGLLNALVFGVPDIRNKLFNTKLTEFFPRFVLWFSIGLVFFYVLLAYADPLLDSSFYEILASVPIWLLVLHAFVFATTESAVWLGYLDHKIGHPWSELSAGIFHFGIWTGGAVFVIISAGLLFAFFSLTNHYLSKNKNDLSPAIGFHTAYNYVKLGILVSAGGLVF